MRKFAILAVAILAVAITSQAQAGWGCAKCTNTTCGVTVPHPVVEKAKAVVCLVCKKEKCICPTTTTKKIKVRRWHRCGK